MEQIVPENQPNGLATIRLPQFSTSEPEVWFTQIEIMLRSAGVDEDSAKFSSLVAALPVEVAASVRDCLSNPDPNTPYSCLKNRLLSKLQVPPIGRAKTLFEGSGMPSVSDNVSPSEILRELRKVAQGFQISDFLLTERFMGHMPSHVRPFLLTQPLGTSIDELARIADTMVEHERLSSQPSQVAPASLNVVNNTSAIPNHAFATGSNAQAVLNTTYVANNSASVIGNNGQRLGNNANGLGNSINSANNSVPLAAIESLQNTMQDMPTAESHKTIENSFEDTSCLHQEEAIAETIPAPPLPLSLQSSSNPIYTHVGSSLDDVTKSLNVTLAHTLADGHCFLHAVALQLNETPNSMQAYKFLMKAIETESTRNKNHYRNFIDENSGRLDLLVQNYLHNKIFDHAAGDLIPQITSNALQKPIHICSERDGGIWKTIVQPSMPQNINKSPLLVHLKDYHYSALIKEKMRPFIKFQHPDD
ncbi:OTU domain [Trinorchestia longiramus]|nr:OTU domain [Trinorchestia longiramus]